MKTPDYFYQEDISMASSKKRSRAVLTVVLCLLVICIVAAATVFGLASHKVKAIQNGGQFTFDYQVTSTASETPTLYGILNTVGATQGVVTGQYVPGKLQLTLSTKDTSEPFTRLYIDQNETLYDAGQLYSVLRKGIVDAYPLAGLVLPSWSLGNYISQTQLATALGVELQSVELQDMTGFTFALGALQKVTPEHPLKGYTYYQFPVSGSSSPVLTVGLPLKSLFADSTPLHVLLSVPEHEVTVELTGSLTAAESVVVAPTSRMSDEDVSTFVQIREALDSFSQFIQSLS